jgi:hypothetical protein
MATKRVMGREVAGKHGVVLADDLNASLGNIDKQISEGLAAASAEVTTLSETVDSLTTDLADKLDNAVSATDRLLGRDTAGAGAVEELTVGGGIEFTGSGGIQSAAFTGDVTKAAGGTALTIASDAVTYAKMQNVSATQRVLGRNTSGSGDVEEVTFTQFLDWVGSAAEGDILYRGASAWSRLAKGTAGQLLRMNSGATAPEWTSEGVWTEISKSSDQSVVNSTTLVDDSELQFSVVSGGYYDVELRLFYYVSNTNADYKFAVALPSQSNWAGRLLGIDTAAAAYHLVAQGVNSTGWAGAIGGNGNANPQPTKVEVMFRAGGNGTFKWQFANNAASSGYTSTTKAKSLLRWRRLD